MDSNLNHYCYVCPAYNGDDDVLHNDIGLDDSNSNNCDDTDGNLNDTCNHSFFLLLV